MERSFLSLRRRLFFIRHMQGECEAASLSRFAGDAHFFAEMLHDFIGDGEAKPRALAVMRFIDFIETIKHVRQIRRGNADARVGDADADDLILRGRRSA